MPDVTKLPKWAQDEIRSLERALGEARAERDAAQTGYAQVVGPSDTFLGRYQDGDVPLGEGTRIVFHLGKDLRLEARVKRSKYEDAHLEVSASYMSGLDFVVQPQVANVVRLRLVERKRGGTP